jgi:hypothetical protein
MSSARPKCQMMVIPAASNADLRLLLTCLTASFTGRVPEASVIRHSTKTYKTGNVRITKHWGAFGNHCCREKAISITYCVCVCTRSRACGRACGHPAAWACPCAYVHVAVLIQHATRTRHIVTSFVAPRSSLYFSTLSHKLWDFRKKVIEYKMCVFIFFTILSTTFPIPRGI